MEEPRFFIPSVITQSCFVDAEGNVVELKPKEIDYFYLLLFLYRKKLFQQSPDLILKAEKGHLLDEDAMPSSVCIYAVSFNDYGVVVNYQYDGLKAFVEKLASLSIRVNLFEKVKIIGTQTMKMVESLSWQNNEITIAFVDDFAKMIAYAAEPFLRVNLNKLFELSGGKSKLLFLLLKDYSGIGHKNLTKNQLGQLLGGVPQKSKLDGIRDQINEQSNIRFSYEAVKEEKQKIFKFKMNYLAKEEFESEDIPNVEVMEKSKQQLQKQKDNGTQIRNEEGYLRKIYEGEMKKLQVSDEVFEIDEILANIKSQFCIEGISNKQIPTIEICNPISHLPLHIDEEYRLADPFTKYSNSPKETLKLLNEWDDCDELTWKKVLRDGYDKKAKKMCLLTDQQLKDRKLI
jgi:hypothetical protein